MRAFWIGAATQGGADAFVQSSFATGMLGNTSQAARIREVIFEVSAIANAAAANVEIALSRYSKTAMPLITDNDVIAKRKLFMQLNTSGTVAPEGLVRYVFTEDDDVLVVEDPLYFQLDSNATTLTLSAQVRVAYELTKISAEERIALLQLGLS